MNENQHKNNIRSGLQKTRKNLSPQQIDSYSCRICSSISELFFFSSAKKIAIYLPFSNEVSLIPLLQFEKQFFVPVLQKDFSLQFFSYQQNDKTHLNQFKIAEPSNLKKPIDINQLDIILIPLVGFTKLGQRLGMGKGCYDRTLKDAKKPFLVGVGYSFQEISSLEQETHDIDLDCIVTEKQVFYASSRIQKLID